jgi:hypothetical protein
LLSIELIIQSSSGVGVNPELFFIIMLGADTPYFNGAHYAPSFFSYIRVSDVLRRRKKYPVAN